MRIGSTIKLLTILCLLVILSCPLLGQEQANNTPPAGFVALFNGKDLSGWKGVIEKGKPQVGLSEAELAAAQQRADESMKAHWNVVDGEIVFDGAGDSISTAKDYGDFELFVDWKIPPAGDSGLYLRGCPQIQIWDPDHEPYWEMGAEKGSGGIWNNKKNPRFPLVKADNPIGQWNTFHVRMVGASVTVKLNGQTVVDNVTMENHWDRSSPIGKRGPIFLQDHGNNLWFRNLFIREIPAEEARAPLPQSDSSGVSNSARPNILFAIADDASYPHMSAYGTKWVHTPSFDRVAKEGLLFNRCYTPNAKCAPSRACLLTGRNSWQLKAAANHWCFFPPEIPTYVEVLGTNGYATGMTGKGWRPGVANDVDGNKRAMAGLPYQKRKSAPPTSSINRNDYAANFVDFLDDVDPAKPFCFWYGCSEPHRSYEYGSGARLGGKSIDDIDAVPDFWPDNEIVRNDMLDYAFEIEHFDTHLGRMLDELQKRGLLENTIVVVTSDNGMPFPRIKGQEYELSNHLPLAMMWPAGIDAPGRKIDDLVSFIDFAPTYLDLAGIDWDASGMASTPGKSLKPVLENTATEPHREFVLIGKERHDIGRPGDVGYPIRGIVRDKFMLLHNVENSRWPAGNPETGYLNSDGSPTKTEILNARRDGSDVERWKQSFGKRSSVEMFNIQEDPNCMNNVAGHGKFASVKSTMESIMTAALQQEGDPRATGSAVKFDEYPYANLGENGFYERYMEDPSSLNAAWVSPTDFEKDPIPADLQTAP